MGRYFALALGIPAQTQTKVKPKKSAAIHRPNFGLWIVFLLGLLGIIYLMQVNSSSTKGYEIKSLERQLTDLKEVNKRLEIETASLKSIQNIEGQVKTLNLVPSGKVYYVGSNGYAYEQ